ncbi:uncharacterized protein LOC135493049 [Lineus longissimus]|uniref:uncharacterized protein LOC135493049 n=1 Tax=Lineus longissimus TaxID=88925 RepID=UPI00315DCA44
MKFLRTMLARAVKCPPSGSSRKKLPKKQEWVNENLQFLLPYMNTGKTSTNLMAQANTPNDFEEGLERKEDSNDDSDGDMVEEDKVVEGPEKLPDDPEVPPMTSEGPSTKRRSSFSCRTVHRSRVKNGRTTKTLRKGKMNQFEEEELSLLKKLTNPCETPAKLNQDMDEMDSFCRHLSFRLKRLDKRGQMMVVHKIENVVFDIEYSGLFAGIDDHPTPQSSGMLPPPAYFPAARFDTLTTGSPFPQPRHQYVPGVPTAQTQLPPVYSFFPLYAIFKG